MTTNNEKNRILLVNGKIMSMTREDVFTGSILIEDKKLKRLSVIYCGKRKLLKRRLKRFLVMIIKI
jgi:hypothetical protein